MAGLFVTFEGIDGCGKTTQAALLASRLQQQGHRVVHTRQPGGTPLGETLRELLLHRDDMNHSLQTEVLLMCADRADHVASVVRPALLRDDTVICERYTDSTLAYQGYGRGDEDLLGAIDTINRFATQGLVPDVTFLLDLDPEIAFAQRKSHYDRIEARGLEYYQRVRNGYLAIARRHPDRIVVIDAKDSVEAVHRAVVRELQQSGEIA